jgi:hypothetical protein
MKLLNRYPKRGDYIKRIYPASDKFTNKREWIIKIKYQKPTSKWCEQEGYRDYKYDIIKYKGKDDEGWSGHSFVFTKKSTLNIHCIDYLMTEDEVMVEGL